MFAAVVELGALAENADSADTSTIGRQLASGDFAPLGDLGIFRGWSVVCGWPAAFDDLARDILSRRRHLSELPNVLGPLSRYFNHGSKVVIRDLVQSRIAAVLRQMNLPFRHVPKSIALGEGRKTTISMWDAVNEFGVSPDLLHRLAKLGTCFIDRSRGETGLHLFDKARLRNAIATMRAGVGMFQFAKALGVPAYVAPVVADCGLVERVSDADVLAMSLEPLLDPRSVGSLDRRLAQLPHRRRGKDSSQLSTCLSTDLSPIVWATAFQGVTSGEVRAYVRPDGQSWSERLLVNEQALREYVAAARSLPLPDLEIPAWAAAPLIGVNQVTLGRASKAGLLRRGRDGLPLKELSKFRQTYVLRPEIAEWFQGSGIRFANTMAVAGVQPAAKLENANVWRRSDVERVFGSQRARKVRWIESQRPEF